MNAVQQSYNGLPADTSVRLQIIAERIRMRLKRSAEDIVEIGRDLKEAQDALANQRNGTFLAWIRSEFDMSQRVAYNFMAVAERIGGDVANFASYSPSALYLLASASEEVATHVTEQVSAGEVSPTYTEVKRAIDEAKEAQRRAKELEEQLADAAETVAARERQRAEANATIERMTADIHKMEDELRRLRDAKQLHSVKPKEVRVEVPVVPPEVEQRLADMEREVRGLTKERDMLLAQSAAIEKQAQAARQTPARAILNSSMSEAEYQGQIIQYAVARGWIWDHKRDDKSAAHVPMGVRRDDMGAGDGSPDLILCRPPRLLLVEVKRQGGKLRPKQQTWRDALLQCPGVEYLLVEPSDWSLVCEALT